MIFINYFNDMIIRKIRKLILNCSNNEFPKEFNYRKK